MKLTATTQKTITIGTALKIDSPIANKKAPVKNGKSFRNFAKQFWALTEQTSKIDTKPFEGLL